MQLTVDGFLKKLREDGKQPAINDLLCRIDSAIKTKRPIAFTYREKAILDGDCQDRRAFLIALGAGAASATWAGKTFCDTRAAKAQLDEVVAAKAAVPAAETAEMCKKRVDAVYELYDDIEYGKHIQSASLVTSALALIGMVHGLEVRADHIRALDAALKDYYQSAKDNGVIR